MIAFNCMTPQFTSLAITLREALDFTPIISKLDIPILATYGMKDAVALPIAGEHIVASCRNASASFYEGVDHAPLIERPERFNRELNAFATRALSGKRRGAARLLTLLAWARVHRPQARLTLSSGG